MKQTDVIKMHKKQIRVLISLKKLEERVLTKRGAHTGWCGVVWSSFVIKKTVVHIFRRAGSNQDSKNIQYVSTQIKYLLNIAYLHLKCSFNRYFSQQYTQFLISLILTLGCLKLCLYKKYSLPTVYKVVFNRKTLMNHFTRKKQPISTFKS